MAKRRPAYRNLIPEPITRILALHGPVHVASGLGPSRVSVTAHVVPFDDMLVLFLRRGSPFAAALDRDPGVELSVQGGDTNYSVRMHGRAVVTGTANAHERRLEILPWLPEGATLQSFLAVELIPERIDYAFDEGEERRFFRGATEAAEVPARLSRWLFLTFRGVIPAVAIAFVALWAYIGWWGVWFTLRPLALLSALIASFGLIAACRLVYRVAAHRRWQRGTAARHHGDLLSEGLLPVRGAQVLAGVTAAVSLLALALCGAAWGTELLGVTLAATQLWFLLPLWTFRFMGDMSETAA